MIKLGLIGKGIAHSQSPHLYRRFLGPQVHYDLLDVADASLLPDVAELSRSGYAGINITTPWKEHYASYAIESARRWNAVNCLKISATDTRATNTDATALFELIPELRSKENPELWVILGSGVMARMAEEVLIELGEKPVIYSRRKGDEIGHLNLEQLHKSSRTKIVINACSRSFNFQGKLDATWVFWDFNYAHQQHETILPSGCKQYIDGLSLLETQARHAVKFWELQDRD